MSSALKLKPLFAALLLSLISLVMTAVLVYAMTRPKAKTPTTIGAYATDLKGRTPHQQENARRAASFVDGQIIQPGAQFSFNETVHSWDASRGYLKAPVSYDGVLVDDYGGGVCETSTTIYNAALLAGLTILERHPHTFSPSYAPVGRDAAVAYPGIDLRLRNPYPFPITVHIGQRGHMMVCRFTAVGKSLPIVRVTSQTVQIVKAQTEYIASGARLRTSRWHLEGRDGYHILVFREIISTNGQSKTSLISDDNYMPLSAVRQKSS